MIQRVRVRFARSGVASQMSHIQQIETFRRAIGSSPWPVARSQGKRPKPKMSFGPAIAVGYESEAEYADVEMESRLDLASAAESLQPRLPDGIRVLSVRSIPRFFPSLENSVNVIAYDVVSQLVAGRDGDWRRFWEKETFPVTKKKGTGEEIVDARRAVRAWRLNGDAVSLELRIGPKRTLKPERIVQAVLGLADPDVAMGTETCRVRVIRKSLFLEKGTGELAEI